MAQSTFIEGNRRTFVASADLSAKQYFIAKLHSVDGQIALAAAATDNLVGVIMNKPKSGDSADVYLRNAAGTGKVKAGGTISIGDALTSNGSGQAITTTTGNDQIIGYALHAAVANDIVEYAPAGFVKVR